MAGGFDVGHGRHALGDMHVLGVVLIRSDYASPCVEMHQTELDAAGGCHSRTSAALRFRHFAHRSFWAKLTARRVVAESTRRGMTNDVPDSAVGALIHSPLRGRGPPLYFTRGVTSIVATLRPFASALRVIKRRPDAPRVAPDVSWLRWPFPHEWSVGRGPRDY
jgi:hypothetical protein